MLIVSLGMSTSFYMRIDNGFIKFVRLTLQYIFNFEHRVLLVILLRFTIIYQYIIIKLPFFINHYAICTLLDSQFPILFLLINCTYS